ncbi:MAG: Calx-beta domain-containing protein [Acidimicrobiia bacterium]
MRPTLGVPSPTWLVVIVVVPLLWVSTAGSSPRRPDRAAAAAAAAHRDVPHPHGVPGLDRKPHHSARCPNLFEITSAGGGYLCTHGADPAPPGIDYGVPRPLVTGGAGQRPSGIIFNDPPGSGPTAPAGAPGIGCFGNGTDGNRVQALYAVPDGQPDRFEQVVPSIRRWAAETDAVFAASAAETGGIRHIRWVTDDNCQLDVDHVRLSALGAVSLETTELELAAQGYNRADRKYLVWMDATEMCGIAGYYTDQAPGPENLNNGNVPGLVARVDAGCWGLGSQGMSVEAHELMHSLGAVLPGAPNATLYGHCEDISDRMCYDDGGLLTSLFSACPSDNDARFDCRHDDYYHTDPAAGNYLASNWNTADSSFLSANVLLPAISIGDAAVTEGHGGTIVARFPVTLVFDPEQAVTVNYTTADRSATAGSDYRATSGVLRFSAGETTKTIGVTIFGDTEGEYDETFAVVLSNAVNGALRRGEASGSIANDDPRGASYWMVARDGGIFTFGDARFYGSTGNIALNQPIVGMDVTPTASGYWFVARDGGIFSFGDAGFFGSGPQVGVNQDIVAMAATPSGKGYWFAGVNGAVYAFGDAVFAGSASPGAEPIVGVAATASGKGYWLAGRDGTVFDFGDAPSLGSVSGLNQPIVGVASTPTGKGYWLVARDGGIFTFGDARFWGSTGAIRLNQPIVGMAATPTGGGYWLVAGDGGIFTFGDARFWGSTGAIALNQPIVGMTSPR